MEKHILEKSSEMMVKALKANMPESGCVYQRYSADTNLYMILMDGLRMVGYNSNESTPDKLIEKMHRKVKKVVIAGEKTFKVIMSAKDILV